MFPGLFFAIFAFSPDPQTQTPPPVRITETVVVSARDAKTIADALDHLRSSRDPLVAKTVADNLVKLTDAMAASGRVNEIGPLTGDEQEVIQVRDLMEKYSFPGGPIFVRPRNPDSSPGPRLFNFTRPAFIAMCADMASNPLLQFREIQENKMIVVARMIADLNEQQDQVISERSTLEGLLLGFKNQDVKGVIIGRVQGIADALAVNADQNAAYDLVPPEKAEAFRKLTHMESDVFEAVAQPRIRHVNVAYDGKIFATTVDHFVWFFLRFLLADADTNDPGVRERRTQLGSDLLDHLTDQLQARVIESVLSTISSPGVQQAGGFVLGDFSASGPGLEALKSAPGLDEEDSRRGPEYKTLRILPKNMRRLPELREWLAHELAKRSNYSILSASTGSTFAARLAGSQLATSVTKRSTTTVLT